MKNKTKFLRIIAFAAVIGFQLTGCDNGGGGSGGNNDNTGGHLGDTLELSGQVYLGRYDENTESDVYENYNGNLTVVNGRYSYDDGEYTEYFDDHPVLGQITNGHLSYSIGTPSNLSPLDFEDFGFGYPVHASKANVRGYEIDFLIMEPSSSSYYSDIDLYRGRETEIYSSNSGTWTIEYVGYVYVEEDVTVSGTGRTYTDTGFSYSYTQTFQNFSLALKAGWNAVYTKQVITEQVIPNFENPTSETVTSTYTISLGNPSNLLWVLEDYDGTSNFSGSVQESRSLLNAPETGNPDRIRQRRGK